MDTYPKTLREVPDDDLAELLAERESLAQCSGLERELVARWLAARDTIEWLLAEDRKPVPAAGRGLGL